MGINWLGDKCFGDKLSRDELSWDKLLCIRKKMLDQFWKKVENCYLNNILLLCWEFQRSEELLSIITSNTERSLIYLALKVYQYINWISIWMRGTYEYVYIGEEVWGRWFFFYYFVNQKSSFTLPINSMHLLWCLFYIINSVVDIKVFKRFSKCIQIRGKNHSPTLQTTRWKSSIILCAKKVYNLCPYLAPPKPFKGWI